VVSSGTFSGRVVLAGGPGLSSGILNVAGVFSIPAVFKFGGRGLERTVTFGFTVVVGATGVSVALLDMVE